MLPQAVSLSDGVCAIAFRRYRRLSKVWKDEQRGIKVKLPSIIINLQMGCSTFRKMLALQSDRTEKRFETKDSFFSPCKCVDWQLNQFVGTANSGVP